VKIQAKIFWVVMPCSVALGYQPLEHWHPTTTLHCVTTQKTSNGTVTWIGICSYGPRFSLFKNIYMELGFYPHTGEMKNAYNILVEKPEGKRPLEKPRLRG
jgi:hypothetical protein